MPILVRPVREQLEHDRVIRLLQAKYKRKFEAGINPGMEQNVPIAVGTSAVFPDLVLQSPEKSRKLLGVVEVETSESVNNLEAMSQWAAFSRLKVLFYLYVPAGSIDTARRLCTDLNITVTEISTYHAVGDQMRFTVVQRAPGAPVEREKPERVEKPPRVAAEPSRAPVTREVARPARPARPPQAPASRTPAREPARPARRAAPAPAARRKPVAKARPRPAKSGSRQSSTQAVRQSSSRAAKKAAPASARSGAKKKTARK